MRTKQTGRKVHTTRKESPGQTPQYTEHHGLFKDEDFTQSSLCPGRWFNCVSVAHKDGVIAVRNSYDDQKRTIFFNEDEWRAFVGGVKKGDFNFGII